MPGAALWAAEPGQELHLRDAAARCGGGEGGWRGWRGLEGLEGLEPSLAVWIWWFDGNY